MKKVTKVTKWNIDSIIKNTITNFSNALIYERAAYLKIDLFDRVIELDITLVEGDQTFFIDGQAVEELAFWHKFDVELARLQAFAARCGEFIVDTQMVTDFMAATTPVARENIIKEWNIPNNLPSFDLTVVGLIAWYEKYTR